MTFLQMGILRILIRTCTYGMTLAAANPSAGISQLANFAKQEVHISSFGDLSFENP